MAVKNRHTAKNRRLPNINRQVPKTTASAPSLIKMSFVDQRTKEWRLFFKNHVFLHTFQTDVWRYRVASLQIKGFILQVF